ncbi:hypothetical protein BGW41_001647 [Actinomortierella wolfii]|nr:hypothetical protein BGW41_001647 [Actinomortierella wolfii]
MFGIKRTKHPQTSKSSNRSDVEDTMLSWDDHQKEFLGASHVDLARSHRNSQYFQQQQLQQQPFQHQQPNSQSHMNGQYLHPSSLAKAMQASGFDYPMNNSNVEEDDNNESSGLSAQQQKALNRQSQFYAADPHKTTKEYHMNQAIQAVQLLKDAVKSTAWKKVLKHKSGCLVYQSTSNADKHPAFKGEHVIRGYRAQDIFSVVGVRKLWDDWYDELNCVESYDESTSLMYMVMKGTMSSKTRDVSMVERIDVERDGTIIFASCSVESNKIPKVSGKVRADIFVAGWIIQPLPSNPPITKVTYVIQTDLLSRLPKFIARRSLAKRALVIATIESHLKKNGVPLAINQFVSQTHRHRSLSEPLLTDKSLLAPGSEEHLQSSSAFLSPLTGSARHGGDGSDLDPDEQGLEQLDDDPEDLTDEDFHSATMSAASPSIATMDHSASRNSLAPSLMSSKSLAPSIFTNEFLDNSNFLGDQALFGDSLLFGKGGVFESTLKQQQDTSSTASVTSSTRQSVTPATPSARMNQRRSILATTNLYQQNNESTNGLSPYHQHQRPQTIHQAQLQSQQLLQQHQQQVAQRPHQHQTTLQPLPSPPEHGRPSNGADSEPPKLPSEMMPPSSPMKSRRDSRMLSSQQNLSPTRHSMLLASQSPATPPLTPTASLDGKDAPSDSDTLTPPKVVLRKPKPSMLNTENANLMAARPSSMAFSSFGMRSPSAMMDARRHSTLIGNRSSTFIPRHGVPIRGNPNVSLHGLSRPSGPNGQLMSNAMKRHSTAPSLDSTRSSTTPFTPMMVLPHRHSETARKALAMFKVLASSPEDRWRQLSNEDGFKSYSRIISGAGLPMLRGEGVITGGWTVEQINAVIESAGCRQIWDDRFENLSIAETFNHNEYLFHITLKGIGSLTGRDLAGVTIIDRDPQTSTLYNVSTSVLDPTIPEDPGRIRALLEFSGWSLKPTFDSQGNTISVEVTFVIQIDIRGTLPNSVVKSMTSSMTMAVQRLNQFINKVGYPPYASHIAGTRLLDTFDPKTGFYELCYKAAPGWTEVRVGRKVYKDGYDFFIKPDDPTVRVELAPDFGGVRVWTTLDHEGQSIIAQVTRKGQVAAATTVTNKGDRSDVDHQEEADAHRERKHKGADRHQGASGGYAAEGNDGSANGAGTSSCLRRQDGSLPSEDSSIAASSKKRESASRKRRSASFTTLSTFNPNALTSFSSPSSTTSPTSPCSGSSSSSSSSTGSGWPPSASSTSNGTDASRPDSQVSVSGASSQRMSQGSERSRSRGRLSRGAVPIPPAGAPQPPLPRRSSSLTRYSLPLAPYVAEADAPPVPVPSTITTMGPVPSPTTSEHTTSPTPSSGVGIPARVSSICSVPLPSVKNSSTSHSNQANGSVSPATHTEIKSEPLPSLTNIPAPTALATSTTTIETVTARSVTTADTAPARVSTEAATIPMMIDTTCVVATATDDADNSQQAPLSHSPTLPPSPKDLKKMLDLTLDLAGSPSTMTEEQQVEMASAGDREALDGPPQPQEKAPSPTKQAFTPEITAGVEAPLTLTATTDEVSTVVATPLTSAPVSSSLKSSFGTRKTRDVRVTFSLDTVDKPSALDQIAADAASAALATSEEEGSGRVPSLRRVGNIKTGVVQEQTVRVVSGSDAEPRVIKSILRRRPNDDATVASRMAVTKSVRLEGYESDEAEVVDYSSMTKMRGVSSSRASSNEAAAATAVLTAAAVAMEVAVMDQKHRLAVEEWERAKAGLFALNSSSTSHEIIEAVVEVAVVFVKQMSPLQIKLTVIIMLIVYYLRHIAPAATAVSTAAAGEALVH